MRLEGKPILITGASSGIGAATAMACARAGMPVALAARRVEKLAEVAARIRGAGGKALAVQCDVTRPSECAQAVAQTTREFGSLYAVFANAGYGFESPVLESSDEDIRALFETNFFGTLHTIRAAMPVLQSAGAGHVLICSSALSKVGTPYFAAYSASKAMQDHFSRALRIEIAGGGVHVSSVHPVRTTTEFSGEVARRSGGSRRLDKSAAGLVQTAERVADAVVACLKRPKPEVWTSLPVRVMMGLGTAWPGLTDRLMRRMFVRKG